MSFWSIIIAGGVGGAFVGCVASLLLKRDFWPWFAAGFLAWPIAAIVLVISAAVKPRDGARTYVGISAIFGAFLIGFGALYYLSLPQFQEEDISAVKEQIRSEYLKERGVTKVDVTMIKVDPTKLTGFAVVEQLGFKMTKTCEANLASNGQNYIWRCN